jgi:shikimate dehydrogenase
MRRLGVLGWPVAHSRSPAMHNAALASMGMADWRYQRLPVAPELFEETVRALGPAGFVGANVTIPHKHAALALADEASPAAREIGAANTLTFAANGMIAAENTDAPGVIAALGCSPRGWRALVLGAGGSARAVVWALREAGAIEVMVHNRTHQRAESLAADLGVRAIRTPEPADLLVNCTSVGLHRPALQRSATDGGELNQLGLTFDQLGEYSHVIDLVYRNASTTELLHAARAHGAHTVDGLDVLVEQGALSLELWTFAQPPRDVMRRAARGDDEAA